eukprot:CAMPEP_0184440964 /NCGR_PEP_ID=MMETSP0738-20130409/755838_1 /TAXON_ID=385413 /ORGANISM="Thalassiosira miniscula, Strain CCMP1093" /LENGTH=310 /DNA_ID=CAMNT_0026808879 /DNA_START=965 /DNA_END=1897 /DNA_ORIENTATION=-
MIAAFRGNQLWIANGIGVFENPPFFAHFVATATSIPFLLYIVRRLMRVLQQAPDHARNEFWNTINYTRLVRAVWSLVALLGLVALAGSVVMASSFQVNIYDSIDNLPTFTIYSIIRVYQYLICYPSIVAAGLVLPWLTFLALRRASIGYLPFAIDGIGGLRIYLKIFDGPIFAVQTIAVAIALANLVGWGGFKPVSTLIAVGAPVVVTALAAVLYLSFAALVRTQRETELRKIVHRQNALYSAMIDADNEAVEKPNDIAEELEASVRVYELVRSTRNFGWIKYLANLVIAILPNVLTTEIISQFVTQMMA